jgi:endonuclease YncB( thermonuclease family)
VNKYDYLITNDSNGTRIYSGRARDLGVGKYGRCLGVLFIEGVNINEHLLQEGYAKPYIG